MTLLIDAGNSAIKWAVLKTRSESNFIKESSSLISENKFDSDPTFNMQSQQYPENTTVAFFTDQWTSLNKPLRVVVSCVASESVWLALQEACKELWDIEVNKVISLKEGFGLINAYEKAADLGSDRWCAMIGGHQLNRGAFIVVSVGSALTIDMVNDIGQHLGGLITPGLSMMRQSLAAHTAQVKVQTSKDSTPSLLLANSTKACVEAGIHLSVVKLIEAVYEQESKQVKNLQCFLAGGNAALIADLLSFKCVMIPDLVLRGLAVIATAQSENKNI